jgi:dTDP-4-amino-4,6-dideoxygalactose transaminase/acetyltransferase-like isoleucine patch superfamily enzyme
MNTDFSGTLDAPNFGNASDFDSGRMKTIYPNVRLGKNVVIEDYCIIGYPPKGSKLGEMETIIGDHSVIRSHSVIYAGSTLGANTSLSHMVVIREHTFIGDGCSIGANSIVEHHCRIGNNVRIQGQAGLCEYTVVEDNAWIGPRVITTNVLHPTCDRAKECLAGPTIRSGAIIGANVSIAPDTEIGRRAFIGLGAVVIKSVPDEAIMLGNPARKIGDVQNVDCRYDMMNGENPYSKSPLPKEPAIPLVDLALQHQGLKMEIRLAMDQVILNARFIGGKEVKDFEDRFAAFSGVDHAVGVSSGTDALILVLRALGIGSGDEIITTPHTFIATAEAILAVGAIPVFADIDPDTCNISVERIAEKITDRTKALLPVHLYGRPASMAEITKLAERHHIRVITDAAQAHGAEVDGKPISQWGDATCFSFYPGKNLGAYGDAGAVTTQNESLAKKIALLRDHGRESKYEHLCAGYNSRLDTLQAAVLLVKLTRLSKWNEQRRKWAARYLEGLSLLPVLCPRELPGSRHVYHLFAIQTAERDRLQSYLKERGISTGVHYPIPLHLQPALQSLGYRRGDFPVAEGVASRVLSLPMFPELTDQQVERVITEVHRFFQS